MTIMETGRASGTRAIHSEILSTMKQMVFESANPHVRKFRDGFRDIEAHWRDVGCRVLPAARPLNAIKADTRSIAGMLLAQIITNRESLFWEQTYSKADRVVGDAFLSGYAFSEITGQRGPFISDRLRSGVGVWEPNVEYPLHWHDTEEIYWILSGSAGFQIGREQPKSFKESGEIVFVPSSVPHSFGTRDEVLVMFYLWQGGDLRQVSEFERKIS
ncbi:MAG: dimethylsulfonioproprionate lyase family protein [Gammaproteobacteria bacterium]|nr:dimethylsulfonioproprionate lyase family protein [Gammaproteobacteria bacterium]